MSGRLDKETFTLIYLRGKDTDQENELTVNWVFSCEAEFGVNGRVTP